MMVLGACVGVAAGLLGYMTVQSTQKVQQQEPIVKRYSNECAYMRLVYKDIRKPLWADSWFQRHEGAYAYAKLMASQWHEANICAPDGMWLGADCSSDDRACMIHALDWAIVNTR